MCAGLAWLDGSCIRGLEEPAPAADLVVMRQLVNRPSCCRLHTYTLYDQC
jgi:hypothetical protein